MTTTQANATQTTTVLLNDSTTTTVVSTTGASNTSTTTATSDMISSVSVNDTVDEMTTTVSTTKVSLTEDPRLSEIDELQKDKDGM